MNPVPIILALISQHPDAVAGLLSFVLLGLVNAVLPTKVQGGALKRVVSVLVDRLSPLTRKDALNTVKWPLFSASVLRDVADAIDPPTPPTPPSRPSLPLMALVFTLSVSLVGCTPSPRPGGVYAPSGTLATIDTVARILGILAPAIKPLVLAQIPSTDVDGRRAADISLTAFEGSASAWLAGRATWDTRAGGGYCDAYAATGAITSSLSNVIRTLGRVGVGMNPELNALVDAGGILADRLAYCDPVFDAAVPSDANADAQTLLRARSVAGELRELVAITSQQARERGRPLVPLPAISH